MEIYIYFDNHKRHSYKLVTITHNDTSHRFSLVYPALPCLGERIWLWRVVCEVYLLMELWLCSCCLWQSLKEMGEKRWKQRSELFVKSLPWLFGVTALGLALKRAKQPCKALQRIRTDTMYDEEIKLEFLLLQLMVCGTRHTCYDSRFSPLRSHIWSLKHLAIFFFTGSFASVSSNILLCKNIREHPVHPKLITRITSIALFIDSLSICSWIFLVPYNSLLVQEFYFIIGQI